MPHTILETTKKNNGFKKGEKMALTMEERQELFAEEAKENAKEICGSGTCMACFKCGHTNKASNNGMHEMPRYGKGETCPLEKYNVTPDTRSFAEKLMAGAVKNLEPADISLICACCEHAEVAINEDDDCYEIQKTEDAHHDYCMDCPANSCMETIMEGIAEAGMS